MSKITLRVYEKAAIDHNFVLNKEFNTDVTAKRYFKNNYTVNLNTTLAYIDSQSDRGDAKTCIWKLENSKRWAYIGM